MHADLHTFSLLSIPFGFVDRVLYSESSPNGLEDAQRLFDKTRSMVEATGLTWVMEQPARQYVKSKLHRSTSGYTLNALRIPSCTIELGPMLGVPSSCKEAGVLSIRNIMRWAGMMVMTAAAAAGGGGPFESVTTVPVIKVIEPYRYVVYPQATVTGIVDHHVPPGSAFKKGDLLLTIRSMDGQVLSKMEAEMDGFVIVWMNGIAKYRGNSLGLVGVPDAPIKVCMSWEEIDRAEEAEVSILL
jgi:predicted deacylase